jgi:hypothetical protein
MRNAVIIEAQNSPYQIQRPDYRNNGKYQFVNFITHSGAESCVHLTAEEISEQMTKKIGPGHLTDDGVDLWWHTDSKMPLPLPIGS